VPLVGSLTFLSPWLLIALALLPALWWLLKVTPPAPRRVRFPALGLLLGLKPGEETAARTPLWLALLRLLLAAIVILALAHPVLRAGAWFDAQGPVLLVVDDGWAAARDWSARRAAMTEIVDQAEREGRAVALLTTAAPESGEPIRLSGLMRAAQARGLIQALRPKPWPSDRAAALEAVAAEGAAGSAAPPLTAGPVIWISDGVEDGAAFALAERLQRMGSLRFVTNGTLGLPHLLLAPETEGGRLHVRVARGAPGEAGNGAATLWVRALDDEGRLLTRQRLDFAAGERRARAPLAIPVEVANRIARLDIEDEPTAGAVVLVDERWRRRLVGLVSAAPVEAERPLLGELYYLERALAPFSEVRRGEIAELLRQQLSALVLTDVATIAAADVAALERWTKAGGVLLRFAGPRLAQGRERGGDELIPVRLRRGGRAFGGVMSWTEPMALAPFDEESPFAGLAVPEDVLVKRQVLAEPALDLGQRTWARLADGTPLVTAERRGKGWLVLVHTTANTQWSNLPLSGLFVEMLQRAVGLSKGAPGALGRMPLEPLRSLDGFGRLGPPLPAAVALAADAVPETAIGPEHPPGLYGSEGLRVAVNLSSRVNAVEAISGLPSGARRGPLTRAHTLDLKPWLVAAAFALALVDLLVSLALRGLLSRRSLRKAPAREAVAAGLAALMMAAAAATWSPARAQPLEGVTGDEFVVAATRVTRLAYVLTGVSQVDETSRAGLWGLSRIVARRSSAELADPLGVDIEQDELLFFPLLYWPVTHDQPEPSAQAVAKLNRFLRTGGTIVFDTRDQQFSSAGDPARGRPWSAPGNEDLQRLVRGLDIPPLVPVPADHVLTKSYYLMQDFPGRWSGGTLWVEAAESRINDGVSPVVIGGNDWAAAWAFDETGLPLYPVVPGGHRQREMALRFGINLVMYALTGNYKSDQVHVPAILERLGQ
jgi:hypothetical protein